MANTSLNLTSLDFDSLKNDFKTFLKSQSKFSDFDFEGSNIDVLISIITHNTFKNSFYLNMVAAEMFLDSAQLLDSVRSHAKELNYCPRSARSSKAVLRLTFRTNPAVAGSSTVNIPKGTGFNAVANFKSYTFTTSENITVSSSNNSFVIDNVEVFEGPYVYDSYVMNYSDETQRFILTNEMIDLDSLSVTVIEDDGSNILSYRKVSTLLDLNEKSQVFFVQPGIKEKYEVVFGDNILGRKPKDGSIIRLDYRVCAADAPNGAVRFSLNDDFGGGAVIGNVTVETIERATNGSLPETIDSIKYYAPRHFQTQERAVTVDDYETLMKIQFPEINAISVYGGEELNPPQYGKVFVAVDIANVDGLPDSKKLEYYQFLKRRSPLSIDPVFVEPETMYVRFVSMVNYNINLTTIKPDDIKALVKDAVIEHNNLYLNDFKSKLRYSKLISDVDNAHESIISNQTKLLVYKKINPKLNTFQNFYLNFGVAVKDVTSSKFTLDGQSAYISDNGNGVLFITVNPRVGVVRQTKRVGTVNYKTGQIKITNFTCSAYEGGAIKIISNPTELDVASTQNQILTIEDDEIIIDVTKIRE